MSLGLGLALRAGVVLVAGSALLFSLAGILLTGPVVTRGPGPALEVAPSPARLRATVESLCRDFAPRGHRHAETLERAASFLAEELRQAGLEVELQDYETDHGRFRNVVGLVRGSDPALGVVVIGAHYDAYAETPGADDNASGVAVLLELARTLPATPARQTRYFVAFGTEEPPFFGTEQMGSAVFARSLHDRGIAVDLMIALDLVGYYSDVPGSQNLPLLGMRWYYPDRGNFVAVVGDLRSGPWIARVKRGLLTIEGLEVHSLRAPKLWAPVDLSDHESFRRLGMPGVLVTDTAFMRYPHHHQPSDTPEKLDYERMALLVRGLHAAIWDGP